MKAIPLAIALLVCGPISVIAYRAVVFHQRVAACFSNCEGKYTINYDGRATSPNCAVIELPECLRGGGPLLVAIGSAFATVHALRLSRPNSHSVNATRLHPELRAIAVEGPITGSGVDWAQVGGIHVQDLQLSSTEIDDSEFASLLRNKSLTAVSINRESALTGRSLQSLQSHRFLKEIEFLGHPIGTSLENVDLLNALPHLEFVMLKGRQVDDDVAVALARQHRLRFLFLRDTAISDRGVDALASAPALIDLYIDGSDVSSASIEKLAGIRTLRKLAIQGHRLADTDDERLTKLMPWCDVRITTSHLSP